ncbi:SdpA family antimicrobial peptide system protein [Micromonospora lupini]|uniref:SdpA family antimicrobial peptide system protein n=1 Tax=Micromonospora lupini TaxID=285679 RepID=UPI00224E9ED7|nr:SdpA family antimicrobial peptide system protein [Micromonospora lupini]MCX5069004.1 SdpA family antimicrobial peptide system protein [Micromonospora lupini]
MALVLLMLAVSIFFSFPSNVLSSRDGGPLRSFSSRLLPQSWGFFTKPPSDPEFVPYRVGPNGTLEFASLLPNSQRSNMYGLSRRQRAQGPELASLANQVQEWSDCADDTDCLTNVAGRDNPRPVTNFSPVATLCGKVLLVETKPVPWAFRDDYDGWRLDVRAALVNADCS